MVKDIGRKEVLKLHTKHLRLFLLLQMLIRVALMKDSCPLFLCRGVSINVLRHEAEFYGITPLGMCSDVPTYGLTLCAQNCPNTMCPMPGPTLGQTRSVWVSMARRC